MTFLSCFVVGIEVGPLSSLLIFKTALFFISCPNISIAFKNALYIYTLAVVIAFQLCACFARKPQDMILTEQSLSILGIVISQQERSILDGITLLKT